MRYGFIAGYGGAAAVSRLCRMLAVSRAGYYAWCGRGESPRRQGDRALLGEIARVHAASRQAYGAKKTWLELNAQGVLCGKHRVARLRRQAGIEARRTRRFRVIVEHHHTAPAAPNRVQRRFRVGRANAVWVGDMTHIRTRAGFLHLAVLLDLYSRRVVGWAMGERPTLTVASAALTMALLARRPARGLIHHTDQGPLYAAHAYRAQLRAHCIAPSMSGKGNAYDNAVAESFFGNLKNELVHHCDFLNREQARAAIFDYIEIFYNRQRRHQTLGYVSPMQFEQMNGVS